MKGILGLLRNKLPPDDRREAEESVFFTTAFADHGISAEQSFSHLAQGRSRQGGVERLQRVQFQQRRRRRPGPRHRCGRVECTATAALSIGDRHAVLQAGREREAQAVARAARDQRQPLAVVG